MFWHKVWHKKETFETRPVYSIRQELEYLRPFVCPRYAENAKTYTEEDVQAAEQRLGYQLPIPVRELYLVMGDILCRQNAPSLAPYIEEYFIPLEQLHWDGQYLLLYASTASNVGCGIDRKDPYVDVFQWVRKGLTPKGRLLKKIRRLGKSGPVRKSVCRYSIYRYWGYKLTYWDYFVYRQVLRFIYNGWSFRRDTIGKLDPFFVSCVLPRPEPALCEMRENLAKYFTPLCQHPELNEVRLFGKNMGPEDVLVYGWINKAENCVLLLCSTEHQYGLIASEPVPYSFALEVERQTGMVFYAADLTGMDRVQARFEEMEQAGLR